jgi:hypothetical protein
MSRREFRRSVKVEILKRAALSGTLRCEECHAAVKTGEIHHVRADGLEIDKSRSLTAEDGLLLCCGTGSCHARHTAADVPAIARAKRQEASHLGARTAPTHPIKSAPFPVSERVAKREPKPRLERRPIYVKIGE